MDRDRVLETLYVNLETRLSLSKKKKLDSVFLNFLNMKSNSRLKLLSDASEKFDDDTMETVESMIEDGLVKEEEDKSVSITGKGVWQYENGKFLSEDDLIQFIDEKFFSISSNQKNRLSSKEKVIILTMIALRAFSLDYCLDLQKRDSILNTIEEATNEVYELAMTIGLFKDLDKATLYGKKGNEHKVSNLYRHTDSLPKRTSFIFRASGNQKYFLDVRKEGSDQIDEKKLSRLIARINKTDKGTQVGDFSHVQLLIERLEQIAYTYGVELYEKPSESYISPDYDEIIADAIKIGIYGI